MDSAIAPGSDMMDLTKIARNQAAQSKAKAAANAVRGKPVGEAEATRAAEEFEAVFLSQMLEHMFQEVDFSPMAGDGPGKEVYKSMLLEEYGKLISQSGGIGLADQVKREMLKMQEVQDDDAITR